MDELTLDVPAVPGAVWQIVHVEPQVFRRNYGEGKNAFWSETRELTHHVKVRLLWEPYDLATSKVTYSSHIDIYDEKVMELLNAAAMDIYTQVMYDLRYKETVPPVLYEIVGHSKVWSEPLDTARLVV